MTDQDCWYAYMVRCRDNTLYSGIAKDLDKRLKAHNFGQNGAKYTRARRPVSLVYVERCLSRAAAARREYQLKKMPLAAKMHLIREQEGAQGEGPAP